MKKSWSRLLPLCVLASAVVVQGADAGRALAPIVSGNVHDALFAVEFDQQAGVAVGAAGAIYDSRDGGKTWKAVTPAPTPLSLLGVSSSAGRSIAVGQTGLVLTRENDKPWQQADSGSQERLFAVSLNSKGEAVAVGSFGTVLRSQDAGHSWQTIAPDWTPYTTDNQQPHLYTCAIDEAGTVTIAGEFGLILRLTAQSKSWQLLHKGDASLFAMELKADGSGYAVGQSGSVLRTADGGRSWQAQDVGSAAILLGVHASDNGHVLITGMRDAVSSSDGGKTWQHLSDPLVTASWYAGVAQGAGGALIAVGNAGQIVRVND